MSDIQIRVVKGAGRPRFDPTDKRIRASFTIGTKVNDQIRSWFDLAKTEDPTVTLGDVIKDMVDFLKANNFDPR